MAAWINWARTQRCEPAVLERPASRAELKAVLERAPGPVRVAGAGHSFTGGVLTSGTLLSLERLDRVLDADPASGLVRVEAGITLHRLSRELHVRGLALPNLGDIDAQSLAGALATGTHGTGARHAEPVGPGRAYGAGAGRRERARAGGRRPAARGPRRPRGARRGGRRHPALRARLPAARRRCAGAARGRAGLARRARRRRRPLRVLDLPALAAGAHPDEHLHRRPARGARPRARVARGRARRQPRVRPPQPHRPALAARDPGAQPRRRAGRVAARAGRLVVPHLRQPAARALHRDGVRDPARRTRPTRSAERARSSPATRSRSRSSCGSWPPTTPCSHPRTAATARTSPSTCSRACRGRRRSARSRR